MKDWKSKMPNIIDSYFSYHHQCHQLPVSDCAIGNTIILSIPLYFDFFLIIGHVNASDFTVFTVNSVIAI